MVIELINTGSELMLGRVLNTHQQWVCRALVDLGCVVSRQVAVPDAGSDIQLAVRESLARADLIITTGGLGPTSDDVTRDFIAQLLGRPLREDGHVLARLQAYFTERGRPMPVSTRAQALVPEGALVLQNQHGTAPGLAMEVNPNPFRTGGGRSWLFMLPGPPRELRPMFTESVIPLIRKLLPPNQVLVCRTLRATGLGESVVEERIAPFLRELVAAGLELGYCARPGQVDVRLVGQGTDAAVLVDAAEKIAREQLAGYLYGIEEEEIETLIVNRLTARKQTLALAESCTGGSIANRLTNVPGASAVLLAGVISYSNESKSHFLGVSPELILKHGAVSEPVARQMAEGARRETGADFALSVTGIAGPSGGTPAKPVGTVFIGLASAAGTVVEKKFNHLDRESFKQLTAQQALDLLRRTAAL
ncbi:MAG TPA: competence/damage-inducible protein A [Clostridia bacterium]|nr:competence/damage-inducible protein A [Clostridia bacterium]